MKHVFLALSVFALAGCATFGGVPSARDAAPSLAEAGPDLETFPDFLAPEPKGDDEDRAEFEAERDAVIAELEKGLEANTPRTTRSGDLYELGQQQQTRSYYLRDRAVAAWLEAYDRYFVGETLEPPQLEAGPAKDALLKSLATFRDMLANDPNHFRRDELNWLIGSLLARVGNDHCESYFTQAIQHSKSPEWAMRARISRADWLVSKGKPDEALALYEEVRKTAPPALKAYVTYRLGWVYLAKAWGATGKPREDGLAKAEAAFKLVVLTMAGEDDKTRFKLRREAARDLTWLWAVNGDEKEPLVFLEKVGLDKELLPEFREKLALEAIRQRKLDKAVAIYADIAAKDPESPRLPDYHLRLARAYVVAGDPQGLRRETETLQKLTSNAEDPWFKEHGDDEKILPRAKRMLALLPLTAGLELFRVADSEKDPAKKKKLLEGAVKELGEHVKTAQSDPQLPMLRMQLASGLLALERLADALAQLDEIAKLGTKTGDLFPTAIAERLNIIVKLDADSKYPPVPPPGEVPSPLPLPELKKRFAAVAEDFLKLNPEADVLPALRFQMAQDLFVYGHYDEALKRYEDIVTAFPGTEQAKSAIEISLSLNLKRANWEELVRLSTAYLNNRKVKGRDLREYIKQNLDYGKERRKEADATVH